MPWIVKRLLVSVFLVWCVATILFLAIHLVPGDPATALLTHGGAAPDPQAIEALRERLGLNEPILSQYLATMRGFLAGDMGRSLQDGAPVAAQIALRLPRTLELIGAAALISVLAGIPLGTWAAIRAGGWADRIIGTFASLSMSVPIFVVGTLLVLLLAQMLRLLPAGGFTPLSEDPGRHLRQLAMPALTIAVGLTATVIRMTRASVLEVMPRDHVRAARARGLRPGAVMLRHVLRNALMPVVTVLALNLGTLLGGTVLVEYVFNWPGLSGFLVTAVSGRDYPAVLSVVLVISVLFIGLNLLVDLLFAVLDPRTAKP